MRVVDPAILKDPWFRKLSPEARLFWLCLLLAVDDQGRIVADPPLLRSEIFPGDDIPLARIEALLEEVRGPLLLYTVEGDQYGQVVKWWKYQYRANFMAASNYPPPEGWVDSYRYNGPGSKIVKSDSWDERGGFPDGSPPEGPHGGPHGLPHGAKDKENEKGKENAKEDDYDDEYDEAEAEAEVEVEAEAKAKRRLEERQRQTTTAAAAAGGGNASEHPDPPTRAADSGAGSPRARPAREVYEEEFGALTRSAEKDLRILTGGFGEHLVGLAIRKAAQDGTRDLKHVGEILADWKRRVAKT
jgi:hypothetical protein